MPCGRGRRNNNSQGLEKSKVEFGFSALYAAAPIVRFLHRDSVVFFGARGRLQGAQNRRIRQDLINRSRVSSSINMRSISMVGNIGSSITPTLRPQLFSRPILSRQFTTPTRPSFSPVRSPILSAQQKSQGAPIPCPPPPTYPSGRPKRPLWIQILATSQLVFIGVALLGTGYYISEATNARAVLEKPRDTTLLPSKIAIEEQESHQPTYGDVTAYYNLIAEMKAIWESKGKGDKVSLDKEDLETHGVSDWSYHEAKRPTVVVWAESTEEVQEIVFLARKYQVPITPFSGGTSLEGHFSSVSEHTQGAGVGGVLRS